MEWFRKFVNKIYKILVDKKAMIKEAATKDTGDAGENFVKEIISSLNYETLLSPYSKTPSDVWGYKVRNGKYKFLHIMLVQVKSSEGDKPSDLSNKEKDELKELSKIIRKEFEDSIPKEFEEIPLIISWGYVGVANVSDTPIIKNPYYIGMDHQEDYTDINFRNYVRREVENMHSLK